MSKTSTASMTSTFSSSSTSTFSLTPTYTPTSSFSYSPTSSYTFSSGPTFTPTPTILPIEVYVKTVSPKPVFQPVYYRSSPSILEIAIIIIAISSFIVCVMCHISLTKSKRQLREEAVARQELRLREEAVARSIIIQNPLYQV